MQQWLAGVFVLFQVVWCILCLFRREAEVLPREEGRVVNPHFFTWIGLAGALLMCIPAMLCVIDNDNLWTTLLPMPGMAMMTAGCLPCIRWNMEGFVVRTFFGRTHECTWADMISWNSPAVEVWIVTAKGRFFIDGMASGREQFLHAAAQRCKNARLTKSAPFDLFNGHVREPGNMLAALVLIGLVGAFLGGIGLHQLLVSVTEDNTQTVAIVVERYAVEDDAFELYSGDEVYRVQYDENKMAERMENVDLPALCEAWVRPGKSSIRVYALTASDGTHLLTFEEINRNRTQVGVFMLLMTAVVGWIIVMTILVGRHPERYSKRWHKALFKPGVLMMNAHRVHLRKKEKHK